VLTALTMTGFYVKEKNQSQDDGYVVDLSSLEPRTEGETATLPEDEPETTVVSSGNVENTKEEVVSEEETEEDTASVVFPWEMQVAVSEASDGQTSGTQDQEEPLSFSEEDVLLWPVVGNVLINYSMDKPVYFSSLQQYKLNPAIIIQARQGQNITAAADGKVLKIKKDEQTGNTITMDLGNGYEIDYGQLTNIQVKEGDRVQKGDYLGDVAEPTRYYSVEGCNVYFALRKDGEPVNPMTRLN
jgi:murein DD-endopeptidase MepM/ murein hydrolase activator NlpD